MLPDIFNLGRGVWHRIEKCKLFLGAFMLKLVGVLLVVIVNSIREILAMDRCGVVCCSIICGIVIRVKGWRGPGSVVGVCLCSIFLFEFSSDLLLSLSY